MVEVEVVVDEVVVGVVVVAVVVEEVVLAVVVSADFKMTSVEVEVTSLLPLISS